MSEKTLVVIDGVRTPFCKMGSALASLAADELGRQMVQTLLTRTGVDPAAVDEVIFGCVAQPADATNIARVIALRAGLPQSVPAMTVQRNCASGFEAITTAQERMRSGRGSIFIVGGVESMSQIPMILSPEAGEKVHAVNRAKTTMETVSALAAFRPHDLRPEAGLMLGLTDPVSGLNMGQTAELLAREEAISREEQDEFALRSQQKAAAAREKRAEEIAAVYLSAGEGAGQVVTEDNGPRPDASLTALSGLKPVFEPAFGSVTAGNSSQISDGAVALLVMTAQKAEELGLEPLGRLVDYAYTGCDPARMGLGPVTAIETLRRRGLHPAEADRVEINEAFAAQVLAVVRQVSGIDGPEDERLNVNGGAIALGHPVGATGARLVLSSLLELRRSGKQRALLALCVGGGQGAALWLERDGHYEKKEVAA